MEQREPHGSGPVETIEGRLERVEESDDETRLNTLERVYDELEKELEDSTSGI